jgi:hypothetical protein
MKYIEALNEHEMIAVFLRTEMHSERYAAELDELLKRAGLSRELIDKPDTTNESENSYRLQVMTAFRGYSRREGYFQNFPEDVTWQRVALSRDDVLRAKYIKWDYWLELSGGSRSPTDAAVAIRSGRTVADVSNAGFLALAEALRHGAVFPELILVSTGYDADVVVLEGHARLTAYALVPDTISRPLTVIFGTRPTWCAGDCIEKP